MKCDHCGQRLTRRPQVTEVVGVVRSRKGGGVHQLKNQRPTGKVWCEACGETLWFTGKLPSLVSEGQMTIV